MVVLRFPHLVLADVGHDDGVAVGGAPEIVDDVRRVQMAAVGQVLDVANGRIPLELLDVRDPLAAIARLHARHQHFERFLQIAHDADVDAHVLVDLGRVDVDVNLLRVLRVGLQVAGDAIVEPHAEREQQVGLLNRRVHPRLAVHAHHAEAQRMRRREAADAEQRLRRPGCSPSPQTPGRCPSRPTA